jgi:cytochrome c556
MRKTGKLARNESLQKGIFMKHLFKSIAASTLLLTLAVSPILAEAQRAPKPETLVRWRQSSYQVLGFATNRIKASIEGQYNKDEVIKSANAIAALANTGLERLFPPGTEHATGWEKTEARPELFKDIKRFTELNANLAKEATTLASTASTGDLASVKTQFGKMTHVCKSCHDDFKTKD